jgi:hypothetical protein
MRTLLLAILLSATACGSYTAPCAPSSTRNPVSDLCRSDPRAVIHDAWLAVCRWSGQF